VSSTVWSAEQIRALGTRTDLVTAGRILGIGRSKCYQLARAGRFPVPVIRHGHRYVVPVAPILALLGLDLQPQATSTSRADDAARPCSVRQSERPWTGSDKRPPT
jgi:hypothetical protein